MTETAVRLKSIGVTEEVVTDLTAAFARALCRHHTDEQPAPVQTPTQILLSKIEAACRAFIDDDCPARASFEPDISFKF